jgi:hypothetical protein
VRSLAETDYNNDLSFKWSRKLWSSGYLIIR